MQKECKSQKIGRRAEKCHFLGMKRSLQTWTYSIQNCCHWACRGLNCQQTVMDGRGAHWVLTFSSELFSTSEFWEKGVLVFCCESNRRTTVSKAQSNRKSWLNLVGHETKSHEGQKEICRMKRNTNRDRREIMEREVQLECLICTHETIMKTN